MKSFLYVLFFLPLMLVAQTTPRMASSFTAGSIQVIPLLITGEGWSQRIVLNNVDGDLSTTGTVRFFHSDGTPWALPLLSGDAFSVPIDLKPGQSALYETQVSFASQMLGWAMISLDQSRGSLLVQTVFRKAGVDRPDLMAGVLASGRAFFRTTTFFDNANGNVTGLGILIPEPCNNACAAKGLQVTIRDMNGTVMGQRSFTQTAGTLNWMNLAESFPETAGKTGTFVVEPVTMFGAYLSAFSLQFTANAAFVAITPFEN